MIIDDMSNVNGTVLSLEEPNINNDDHRSWETIRKLYLTLGVTNQKKGDHVRCVENKVGYGTLEDTNILKEDHIDEMSNIRDKKFISGRHNHEEQSS